MSRPNIFTNRACKIPVSRTGTKTHWQFDGSCIQYHADLNKTKLLDTARSSWSFKKFKAKVFYVTSMVWALHVTVCVRLSKSGKHWSKLVSTSRQLTATPFACFASDLPTRGRTNRRKRAMHKVPRYARSAHAWCKSWNARRSSATWKNWY